MSYPDRFCFFLAVTSMAAAVFGNEFVPRVGMYFDTFLLLLGAPVLLGILLLAIGLPLDLRRKKRDREAKFASVSLIGVTVALVGLLSALLLVPLANRDLANTEQVAAACVEDRRAGRVRWLTVRITETGETRKVRISRDCPVETDGAYAPDDPLTIVQFKGKLGLTGVLSIRKQP